MPWLPGATLFVDIGAPIATGFHQVDNPAIDAEGRIYVTYSGPRGQEAPVSIFRVAPGGAREPFVSGIVNVTSMQFGPTDCCMSRVASMARSIACFHDGRYEVAASDLGLACGLAFAPDGTLLVGDRSGTIFHIDEKGRSRVSRRCRPASRPFISRWDRTTRSTSPARRWAVTTASIASISPVRSKSWIRPSAVLRVSRSMPPASCTSSKRLRE